MKKLIALSLIAVLGLSACGGSANKAKGETITLLTHDSFAVTDTVLKKFESDTGITVNISKGGDAGQVVNQAILTKGSPTGDVLFGVDNTLLGRALDAGIFEPYRPAAASGVDPSLDLDPQQHRVTPVDYGPVCVDFDKRALGGSGEPPVPATLEDLTAPAYKDQLVVENPATSSPGLAFLLATVKRYGESGYLDYWRRLKANGVLVTDGWTQAYNEQFSAGGAGGKRSLVVSYATSPPADVLYATPAKSETDVGVMTDGCFQQVEFAGVLLGTKKQAAARKFVDFLLSDAFQSDIALNMFVYPAVGTTKLPDAFTKYAVKPAQTLTIPPSEIASKRDTWIKDWTAAVTG